MLTHILRELLLPPSSILFLLLASWLLYRRKPRWGKVLLGLTLAAFYLLSIPLVSFWLTRSTELIPPLTPEEVRRQNPQAIVTLGAGANNDSVEFQGRTTPSAPTLLRANYAAFLARELNLPVLTTGGYGDSVEDSEGYVIAQYLKESGVEKVFMETESSNTRENALFAQRIAKEQGWDRVVVVTDASHAPRALMNFKAAGLDSFAAPTGSRTWSPWERGVLLVIPSHTHFDESGRALRTHMAYVWDWLRS